MSACFAPPPPHIEWVLIPGGIVPPSPERRLALGPGHGFLPPQPYSPTLPSFHYLPTPFPPKPAVYPSFSPPLLQHGSQPSAPSKKKKQPQLRLLNGPKLVRSSVGPIPKLLHDFRTTQDRKWKLKDIVGHVAEFSRDQYGSRFLQDAIDSPGASDDDLDMVRREIISAGLLDLSKDMFGNYVVQRIAERSDAQYYAGYVDLLIDHVRDLSLHVYGCRVIQKLLDLVPPSHQARLVQRLEPHVAECVKNAHGNHVIQKILEVVPLQLLDFVSGFVGHALEIAKHPYGCRVLQRCLEYLPLEQAQPLLDEFMEQVPEMINDQYGNYVVQYLLEHGGDRERGYLQIWIRGQLVELGKHKHASNVCEVAIAHGSESERGALIAELMLPGAVWALIHDQYGNYVVQRSLNCATGFQRQLLFGLVDQELCRAFANTPNPAECKHLIAIDHILKVNRRSYRSSPM
ncbi:armadillo-type protein [Ephemerocybe angulata]|uniref:Armadillo-type protein n=1 Tax=Ephemerocybe angulata TaxID=980116 RepID=A0A8H6IHU5_9AGAR|nr:armadillo-type protein [Tulosesus angulatus]